MSNGGNPNQNYSKLLTATRRNGNKVSCPYYALLKVKQMHIYIYIVCVCDATDRLEFISYIGGTVTTSITSLSAGIVYAHIVFRVRVYSSSKQLHNN